MTPEHLEARKIPFTIKATVDFTPIQCITEDCLYNKFPIVIQCGIERKDDYGSSYWEWIEQSGGIKCPQCGGKTTYYK